MNDREFTTENQEHGTECVNRLSGEISPYLLQHATNPVDWYPWGDEAFEKARTHDKPIFLSIGYSSCHWCHVMEKESFADQEVASLMNDTFISIKVDREEMPHIDSIYLRVCQMMNGSAGWPLSIIMTPDKKPFFAATYLPKRAARGIIGMVELTGLVRQAWANKRSEIFSTAREVSQAIRDSSVTRQGNDDEPTEDILNMAFGEFSKSYDHLFGGFGTAPKFPHPHTFMFLLRYWKRTGDATALNMVDQTLSAMRRGGMYDHVGSGFHRYSTDRRWLVPHFEKMLYDQALLCMAYTETFQAAPRDLYRETVHDLIGYVLRDMRSEGGGFYTSEDADSEGEEGRFYVWTVDELSDALPEDDLELLRTLFSVREEGNFIEGKHGRYNILHLADDLETYTHRDDINRETFLLRVRDIMHTLRSHRIQRTPPFRDDKILTDWNGLMIAALAKAFQVFGNPEYLSAATDAASFILTRMVTPEGRLIHLYREGQSSHQAFLDDYAFFTWGLIELYESTLDPIYLENAFAFTRIMIDGFWDEDRGGFYLSPHEAEVVIARPKETYDGALPSGNSAALMNLVRLHRFTGRDEFSQKANELVRAFSRVISAAPSAHAFMLAALDFHIGPVHEIVLAGKRSDPEMLSMLKAVRSRFLPNKVLIGVFEGEEQLSGLITTMSREHRSIDGKASAYVCSESTCFPPVSDTAAMLKLLS
ncbi:MAG: thioredoxin domain-containing protein [Desulfomonilia bacterium]